MVANSFSALPCYPGITGFHYVLPSKERKMCKTPPTPTKNTIHEYVDQPDITKDDMLVYLKRRDEML